MTTKLTCELHTVSIQWYAIATFNGTGTATVPHFDWQPTILCCCSDSGAREAQPPIYLCCWFYFFLSWSWNYRLIWGKWIRTSCTFNQTLIGCYILNDCLSLYCTYYLISFHFIIVSFYRILHLNLRQENNKYTVGNRDWIWLFNYLPIYNFNKQIKWWLSGK